MFILTFCMIVLVSLNGCLNPFSPAAGNVGERIWTTQSTVGELLDNFALAYDYRDSLRYADCLAEEFIFHYYDIENGRYDQWFLDTDLKATGGLFRMFDHLDLEWIMLPEEVEAFNFPDSTLSFVTRFSLTIEQEVPLLGYARFTMRKGNDDRFRVLSWRDDF